MWHVAYASEEILSLRGAPALAAATTLATSHGSRKKTAYGEKTIFGRKNKKKKKNRKKRKTGGTPSCIAHALSLFGVFEYKNAKRKISKTSF